jgi:hypothetical protein
LSVATATKFRCWGLAWRIFASRCLETAMVEKAEI